MTNTETKQQSRPVVEVFSHAGSQNKMLVLPNVDRVVLTVGDITLTLTPAVFGTRSEIVVESDALIQLQHSSKGFVLTRQGR